MTPHTPPIQETALLHSAFRSFDHAAATLQASYAALTARLERMDLELAASNEALRANLREKEEIRRHLSAVLESLSTGVLVADEKGTVMRANQAAADLLSRPKQVLLGRELSGILRDAQLDRPGYPLRSPGGVPLSVARAPLLGEDGRSEGSIVLLHDISIVRRLEERLQRRERLAAMGEMVGRIAHEIRNPLGSIELFASLLRKDLAGLPQCRQYAEHISIAVQAMDRLLVNLLAFTRPATPRSAWHRTDAVIHDALTLAAHVLAQKPVETHVACAPEAGRIWCDAFQMKQALLNLILNAVQAMPEGGRLSICACAERDEGSGAVIRLAVSDTGSGIRPDHLSRIFDPFFTTRDDGTGLGLAIVHTIAEAHRGRVEVDSRLGAGTTVALMLPADPPSVPAGSGEPETSEPSTLGVERKEKPVG